ncbi:hypothetical protein [Tautonia marina]|uniref:hypothetical protein n=1 Tax=Tautonia marina TaxID=2653855 RepID=UPI001260E84E|nr:hypothetical protein [Tautonia marina]
METRLGLELPDDYKRLVHAYGSGSWMGFLWVLNPFSSNLYLNLLEQAQRQLAAERVIRTNWPAGPVRHVPRARWAVSLGHDGQRRPALLADEGRPRLLADRRLRVAGLAV